MGSWFFWNNKKNLIANLRMLESRFVFYRFKLKIIHGGYFLYSIRVIHDCRVKLKVNLKITLTYPTTHISQNRFLVKFLGEFFQLSPVVPSK